MSKNYIDLSEIPEESEFEFVCYPGGGIRPNLARVKLSQAVTEPGGPTTPFNNQTGTAYTIQSTDNGKVITFNNTSPIAVTLPDGLSQGFSCEIVQLGSGTITLTPVTDTINGSTSGIKPTRANGKIELFKHSATAWTARNPMNNRKGSGNNSTYQSLVGNRFINYITLTLAPSGGDFATFDELMEYLKTTKFDNAYIVVSVQPGTYTIQPTSGNNAFYYTPGKESGIASLELKGTNKSTCIFNTYGRLFYSSNVDFTIRDLTFNDITRYNTFTRAYNSKIVINNCNFVDYYGVAENWGSYLTITSCTVTAPNASGSTLVQTFSGGYTGITGTSVNIPDGFGVISSYKGGYTHLEGAASTIQNADVVFDAIEGGRIYIETAPTLTSNNTNYATPLNLVRGDGGYITNGSGLIFKDVYNAQTGTTYTIQSSDDGKIITFNNASPVAVTLPDGLSQGFSCEIVQLGAGVPTATPNTDTINGAGAGVSPSAQWKSMKLYKFSSTEWLATIIT